MGEIEDEDENDDEDEILAQPIFNETPSWGAGWWPQ